MPHTIEYGASLTPEGGSAVHTFTGWGCWFSAAPSYSSRKRKENIISIPFSDSVLDFSKIDGRYYFDESTVTYSLVYAAKGDTSDAKIADMKAKQATIESFLWDFKGSVSDDYTSPRSMRNARCTSFTATPNLGGGVLEMQFTMQGEYIH